MSLVVSELTKVFGEKIAVDRISFEMESSGVFGLIGTNGAGKTTTIRMMLGIMKADHGQSRWNGKAISRETLSFGYMPEERGIYGKTRVLEQLVYFGMLRGMNRTDAIRSAQRLTERLDLVEYRDMYADKLSKGNQQKVQLAATLIHDPTLIVLDEPFSGLDPVNAESLSILIGELIDEKKYIVMSSHQMATVEKYCENLVLLHRGKTVLSGNLKQIKSGYGHTRLVVDTLHDPEDTARSCGLLLRERRADECEFAVSCREDADRFLAALVNAGNAPTRYELREPSLNEIFIEKAGEKS
ncbi:MAG: ATP-binding cassette domain-containing protein [Clostridia bacterium]|nr:ATP-binding cassette domain-containing protein [Clostridia bacterium]